MSLTIEYIGPAPARVTWLRNALDSAGADADILFSRPSVDHASEFADVPDAVVIDHEIGDTETLVNLDRLGGSREPVPALVAVDPSETIDSRRFVAHGAEDVLRIGDDSPGRIASSILLAIDRHELLRVTQSAESRIRAVVEHLHEGVVIVDEDGRVMFANPATEDHLERPLEMLFGHRLPLDIPSSEDDVIELMLGDGTMRYLSVHRTHFSWEGREATLLTLHDISVEHEARDQLQRAKREVENMAAMKATFFANMSHELRLPLASIIGFAELLEKDVDDGELSEFARMIREGGRGLLSTINDVLEMTRMESTGLEPELEAVPVADLVAETVGLSSSLARSKGLILDITGDTSIVASADPALLKRVLTNLVGNAIKFTDEGRVTVTYSRDDGLTRIDVSDTGIGIAPDFIPEMFDEFTQESSGRDRTHGGSGLGLAICKKLVESMNGRVEVESRKGSGTVMSVLLDLDATDPSHDEH